jgi:carbonic anhydrase/acetyltransferase-like protein (isoleucine patch superfamily)
VQNKTFILVGAGAFALVLRRMLERDGGRVEHFCVSDDQPCEQEIDGLKVVRLSDLPLLAAITPDGVGKDGLRILVAVGYSEQNRNRQRLCAEVEQMGLPLGCYVSPHSSVANQSLVGSNIIILDRCVVEPYAVVQSNSVLWSGAMVCHHAVVGKNAFLGPNACVAGHSNVGENTFVGCGAMIVNRSAVGCNAFIGAGVVVSADVAAGARLTSARPLAGSDLDVEPRLSSVGKK